MRSRLPALGALLLLGSLLWTSCSGDAAPPIRTYSMGDRIELGRLVYTVAGTRWLPQIGEGLTARVPRDRFLLIRMTVGSTGAGEALLPNMTLEDDSGRTYPELNEGEGVPDFLGVLRAVTRENAASGNALFDAPPAHYKLRVTDENGQAAALVDLPLTFQ